VWLLAAPAAARSYSWVQPGRDHTNQLSLQSSAQEPVAVTGSAPLRCRRLDLRLSRARNVDELAAVMGWRGHQKSRTVDPNPPTTA
jgi:hypothetical protein